MTQQIIEAMADVARQLEEQLKFYREIGVTDIGDSLPQATALAAIEINPATQEPMPKKKVVTGFSITFCRKK